MAPMQRYSLVPPLVVLGLCTVGILVALAFCVVMLTGGPTQGLTP